MKMQSIKCLGLLLMLTFFTMNLQAQNPPTQKGVSAADQAAIKALFAGVDETKYALHFGGKTVAGKRAVGMNDLKQVKRVTNPAEAAGYIVLIVEGDNVIYVLAVGKKNLTSVLGVEKTTKLNQIMAKYQR